MAVIKMKPTSPGHRGMVKISRDHLEKLSLYLERLPVKPVGLKVWFSWSLKKAAE